MPTVAAAIAANHGAWRRLSCQNARGNIPSRPIA
jgi:hypothetical protein